MSYDETTSTARNMGLQPGAPMPDDDTRAVVYWRNIANALQRENDTLYEELRRMGGQMDRLLNLCTRHEQHEASLQHTVDAQGQFIVATLGVDPDPVIDPEAAEEQVEQSPFIGGGS